MLWRHIKQDKLQIQMPWSVLSSLIRTATAFGDIDQYVLTTSS